MDKIGMLPAGFTAFAAAKPEPEAVSAARSSDKNRLMKSWRQKPTEACEADQLGKTALHIVAETNSHDLAKEITWHYRAKKLDFNLQDNDGKTALYVAAAAESLSIVKLLMSYGADTNVPDNHGITPLMAASKEGSKESVKELLRDKSMDLNSSDRFGMSALMHACDGGWISIAEMLIDKGADVNQSDQQGRTALHLACKHGSVDIIKRIRDAGGDLQARDIKGLGAIHMCSSEAAKDFFEAELRKFAMYRQQFILALTKLPLEGRHGLVLTGVDLERGCPVVLKFYRKKSHRNRALDIVLKLDQDYVASVPADSVGELSRYVFKDAKGYPKFPYCLVFYAGDQSLQTMMSHPRGLRPVMPQQQLLHIFHSVTECVEHMHLQGMVHGNVKPKNIMEFPDGQFRLANLESACTFGSIQEEHTVTLEVCPPEVAKAWLRQAPVMVHPARDVWALGCILYELIFGRKLVADLVEEAQRQVAEGGAAPPQVPPTELLGVLQLLSLLTQQQVSALVSAPRILKHRTMHIGMDGSSPSCFLKKVQEALEAKTRNPGLRATAHLEKGKTKIELKRGLRQKAVQAPDNSNQVSETQLLEESLLSLSDLLGKLLRVDERERISTSDIMQSPVMNIGANDQEMALSIKNMKRNALKNQQKLVGKMEEVSSQIEQLCYAVSETGSRDDATSITSSSYTQPTMRSGATKIQGEKISRPPPIRLPQPSFQQPPAEPLPRISEPESPKSSAFAKAARKKMAKMMRRKVSELS